MDTDIQKRLNEKRSCRKFKKRYNVRFVDIGGIVDHRFLAFFLHNFNIFYIYQAIKICCFFPFFPIEQLYKPQLHD